MSQDSVTASFLEAVDFKEDCKVEQYMGKRCLPLARQ